MQDAFSERLGQALSDKGWSQQVLSKRAGIHHQQIYKLLHGKRVDPRGSTIRRLADALDVSADFLLGRDVPATPALEAE